MPSASRHAAQHCCPVTIMARDDHSNKLAGPVRRSAPNNRRSLSQRDSGVSGGSDRRSPTYCSTSRTSSCWWSISVSRSGNASRKLG